MFEIFLALLIFFIILSAFFSGVETAIISLNTVKVRSLVKQKRKGSDALMRLKQKPKKLLITILLGNNLVNISAASIATSLFTDIFGSTGIGIATGIMTFFILVFGEIIPKSFATQNSEKISLFVARPIEILSRILYPIIGPLEYFSSFTIKKFGSKKEKEVTEHELKTFIAMGKEEGILTKDVAEMINSLLEFEGKKVNEIMTPKSEIAFINGESELKDVVDYVIKTPFSRYPVYKKTKDNIIGILDVDDVLKEVKKKRLGIKVGRIVRESFFIPETKEIDDLLVDFRRKSIPIAIVVNEYGYVLGLVTMEDILEEIVGDIFDKSLRKEIYIKSIDEKTIKTDSKATMKQIENKLGIGLKSKHFNTIGGFIQHKMGRIPKKGEKINLGKVSIVINKANKQGIESLKIIKK